MSPEVAAAEALAESSAARIQSKDKFDKALSQVIW